jgi:hypothetical protein
MDALRLHRDEGVNAVATKRVAEQARSERGFTQEQRVQRTSIWSGRVRGGRRKLSAVALNQALHAVQVAARSCYVAGVKTHHADCVALGCGSLWTPVLELALGTQIGQQLRL